ncbi:mechanosensitive ion channel family protein [Shewanella salipaludis]|uniref:Small-conductance mechanosensitive channel n=1 Tax=Shewanella salipaludis TaxID=2723052 RepID=A0A972G964_9GAMM|nr:mechanosensitive ion channel family protein [Shewanella salipaludis]NMH66855.1 mechanosensitive ion channel family protein [Shewanella salipaludis]
MKRLTRQGLTLVLLCLSLSAAAISQDVAERIARLQQAIDKELQTLPRAKGELKAITEYRVNTKLTLLRTQILSLLEADSPDTQALLPLIRQQLVYTDRLGRYLDQDIAAMTQELGTGKDSKMALQIARRETAKDKLLKLRLETLGWAENLGLDMGQQKQALTQTLLARADGLDSLLSYTQVRLKAAIDEVTAAGKDVTPELTAQVTELKERLAQNSQSLSLSIELLDALGEETSAWKQALFAASGDITHNVLTLNVASSLVEQWLTAAETQAMDKGPGLIFKFLVFLVILLLAALLGNMTKRLVRRAVSNSSLKFSRLLQEFFTSLSGKVIFAMGLLIALSQLGFELGPLLAGFGIAGVIIGFALQDTLSNFASGMMILIYRPYDVGDLISAAGVTGRVSHMNLVSTTIKTLDNQRLIIPNNKIWGDTINNITVEHHRRVDMSFGISYSDSIEQAETLLKAIVEAHPKVLATPAPTVKLHLLGESSVDFVVRPWVKPDHYWDVYWDITREVKLRFDAEGISIPFPQRDVHVYRSK